jgi:hypothetical protein
VKIWFAADQVSGQMRLTLQTIAATPASPFSEGKPRGDAGVAAT